MVAKEKPEASSELILQLVVGGGAGLWHYAPIRKLIISHSSCAQAARPLPPLSFSSSEAGKIANYLMA